MLLVELLPISGKASAFFNLFIRVCLLKEELYNLETL